MIESEGEYILPNDLKLELHENQVIKLYNETLQKEVEINSLSSSPSGKALRENSKVKITTAGLFKFTVTMTTKYKAKLSLVYEQLPEVAEGNQE